MPDIQPTIRNKRVRPPAATDPAVRRAMVLNGMKIYTECWARGNFRDFYRFVRARLAIPQRDVVDDLVVYLRQQIADLQQQQADLRQAFAGYLASAHGINSLRRGYNAPTWGQFCERLQRRCPALSAQRRALIRREFEAMAVQLRQLAAKLRATRRLVNRVVAMGSNREQPGTAGQ